MVTEELSGNALWTAASSKLKYFPSRPGRVESNGKASFSMFINAEGKLVMKNEFQREAFQWTSETIAQRD